MRIRFAIIAVLLAFSLSFSGILSQAESLMSSPRQQMDSGTSASDVVCKSGYVLMIRSINGAAACVSPSSGTTLESRGWGTVMSSPFEDSEPSKVEIELKENLAIETETSDSDDENDEEFIKVNIEDGIGAGDQP